jgi:hypothetical protein
LNCSNEINNLAEQDFLKILANEQNKIKKSRRKQNLMRLDHINSQSLKKNHKKNYNRRNGKLNFDFRMNSIYPQENVDKNNMKTDKKRLKDIILKNKKMFKIDKIKRYETEGGKIADNILRNIQHRLNGRNHFQYQKDVRTSTQNNP